MILDMLSELNETNSVKVKQQILEMRKHNDLLKGVFYAALSPRVKFYIRQIPEYVSENKIGLDTALETTMLNLPTRNLTGQKASDFLKSQLELLSADDAEVLKRIIGKDLKCGVNSSTVNKVWPGLIETTPYMGAISFDEKKARLLFAEGIGKHFSQIKMDGRYANMIIDHEGGVTLESRGGEITYLANKFPSLDDTSLYGKVLNGELTIPGIPRYESNGIISALVSMFKKEAEGKSIVDEEKNFNERYGDVDVRLLSIVFTAWDIIGLDEYYNKQSALTYDTRFKLLVDYVKRLDRPDVNIVETVRVETYEEAMNHFQKVLAEGEEGTILKSCCGSWKDGKPKWQIKMKLEVECDLEIIGFKAGTPGSKYEHTLGSLICRSGDDIIHTDPSLKDSVSDNRDEIWNNQERYMNTIVTVLCNGLSNDRDGNYALLHPRATLLRDDKFEADTLEDIKKIENMKKGLSK